jgi:hypothetical protein
MPKKRKRTRRKFTGWNLLTLAEGYAQTSILTDMAFRATPVEFLLGNPGPNAYLTGANKVSLKELIDGLMSGGKIQGHSKTEWEYVVDNVMSGWFDAGIKTIGTGIAFRAGTKLTRRPRAAANRMFKQLGIGDMVRV